MKHLATHRRQGCLTILLDGLLILVVLIALGAGGLYVGYRQGWARPFVERLEQTLFQAYSSEFSPGITGESPTPAVTPGAAQVAEAQTEDDLPYDKLFITVARQKYQSGDLQLIIPKLAVDAGVWDGTDPKTLDKGACLYEYAQLPGEGNRNVSIAGHRNGRVNGAVTDDAIFYYIDTLGEGDYLYLADQDKIYRYLYLDTEVVEADDWGPIYSQGFSCLTLTSCTPIGISSHRIIVRGKLEEILPRTENFDFVASKP